MRKRVNAKAIPWLRATMLLCLFTIPFESDILSEERDIYYKVPVLKLNVYMMGYEKEDPDMYLDIGSNIEYLNEEFEGKIGFELNNLHADYKSAYLPDLYKDYYKKGGVKIGDLVEDIEQEGAINLYFFETYCEEGTNQALMGFTPVLRNAHHKYIENQPNFDRIFIAYEGLMDKSTLVHEMGHFLGLKHPWEMTEYQKKSQGIHRDNLEHNHMTYGVQVNHFTQQQLEMMRLHALNYRNYLTDRIINVSLNP